MKSAIRKFLPASLLGLKMLLSSSLSAAGCIQEHVSADDPENNRTSIARPKDGDCLELIFPDDVLTWQVNVTMTRDLPELAMTLSSPSKPTTAKAADGPEEDMVQFAQASLESINAQAQNCANQRDPESIVKCWSEAAQSAQAVEHSVQLMLSAFASLEAEPFSMCEKLGLSAECTRQIELESLNLGYGDRAVVAVQFSQQSDPETTQSVIYEYLVPARGQFRAGIGAMFILGNEKEFFSRQADEGFLVQSGPGDDLGMSVAVTANWISYKTDTDSFSKKDFHPFLGIGTDSDEISVFGGLAYTFHRGWSVNLGVAAVKENRLSSSFTLEQPLAESLTSDALTEREYKLRPFIGVSWTQAASK